MIDAAELIERLINTDVKELHLISAAGKEFPELNSERYLCEIGKFDRSLIRRDFNDRCSGQT